MEVGYRLISLLIGYGFGLFQTAIIIGKVKGFDIRKEGSGNAGTTNMLRMRGGHFAVLTFLGDFLKAVLAMALVGLLFKDRAPLLLPLLKLYAGAGAVLGHDFPVYLSFKGGKGVATTAGVATALWPPSLLILLACFLILFFTTHLVAVCSLASYTLFAVIVAALSWTDFLRMGQAADREFFLVALLLTLLCFWRHRSNLVRLVRGEEVRIYLHKSRNAH